MFVTYVDNWKMSTSPRIFATMTWLFPCTVVPVHVCLKYEGYKVFEKKTAGRQHWFLISCAIWYPCQMSQKSIIFCPETNFPETVPNLINMVRSVLYLNNWYSHENDNLAFTAEHNLSFLNFMHLKLTYVV